MRHRCVTGSQKVLRPGFEPGLPRPQRGVLTTRRSQLRATKAAIEEETRMADFIAEDLAYMATLNMGRSLFNKH